MTFYQWNEDNGIGGWLTVPTDIIEDGKVLSLRCHHISGDLFVVYMDQKYMKDFIAAEEEVYVRNFGRQHFLGKNPMHLFIKTLFNEGIES